MRVRFGGVEATARTVGELRSVLQVVAEHGRATGPDDASSGPDG